MKKLYVIAVLVTLGFDVAIAGESFDSLQIDNKGCNLVLVGTDN